MGPINKLTPSWITSGEEMIIVNHQTYRSVPDGHDQVRGSLELLDFIIDEYNADPTRVVAFGNSAGGMHISSVLNNHADRFAGYVMMNSRFTGMTNYFNEPYSNHITGEFTQNGKGWTTQQMWDYLNEEGSRMERSEYIDDAWAAMGSVVEAEMPVWVVHGISDHSLAVSGGVTAYEVLRELYREKGLSEERIDELVKLSIFEDQEFRDVSCVNYHSASKVVATRPKYLEWALEQKNEYKISGSNAVTRVGPSQHQIETIILTYNTELAPSSVSAKDFKVTDYFTSQFDSVDIKRPYSEAEIVAVYSNDEPEIRADKKSVAGRYVIIELGELRELEFVKLDAEGNVVAENEEREIYRLKSAAGIASGKIGGLYTFRQDYSDFEIKQTGELQSIKGGQNAPELIYDRTITDAELDRLIWGRLKGSAGVDIYYQLYLPENYDASKQYPLFYHVSGGSAKIRFDEEGNPLNEGIPSAVSRMNSVWMNADEDVIVVDHQIYAIVPEGYDEKEGAIELIDHLIENYNVDPSRIVAFGNSAGGMFISDLMAEHADRFAGYAQMNSHFTGLTCVYNEPWSTALTSEYSENGSGYKEEDVWAYLAQDGARMERAEYIDTARAVMGDIVDSETAVYVIHGVSDPTAAIARGVTTYEVLRELYQEKGLSEDQIDDLVKIIIYEDEEFRDLGVVSYHSSTKVSATKPEILEWALECKNESPYYEEAIEWAVGRGILSHADDVDPKAVCTRAQIITYLWRAAGSPVPSREMNPFTDVAANADYHNAVLWALENGVTAGTSPTTFSPELTVNHGQAMTF